MAHPPLSAQSSVARRRNTRSCALAGRPGQTASAAARRRGQSAAVLLLRHLLALAQALERLALLWPDGKLTLPRVEQAVNDAAHFTPYHWVDALLAGKSACCTSCSSYALKAASRRSCCVLCSGSCCCWLPSSAATHTRCARCLINIGSGKTAVSCSATPSRA